MTQPRRRRKPELVLSIDMERVSALAFQTQGGAAWLMQFHPLEGGAMLYTEGSVGWEPRAGGAWSQRALGTSTPRQARLKGGKPAAGRIGLPDGRPLPQAGETGGWELFRLPPGQACRVERRGAVPANLRLGVQPQAGFAAGVLER